jgi:hypothetical protein
MTARISILVTAILLASCMGIDTNQPKEAFNYWAGEKPPRDIIIVNGKYWQSSHWTKEYIVYLKLKPGKQWWKDYVVQNNLQIDSGQWTSPSDCPDWFKPTQNCLIYKADDEDNGSRYFIDTLTGVCYIYEIRL